jgi:glutathione S-transferase
LQYDRIDAGNEFGVTKTLQYRVLNPNGLVPTIEDVDFQLWESNVIVPDLAQKSGHGLLYPADIKIRFGAERWMDWQTTVFWPALRPLFIELIRTPPQNAMRRLYREPKSLPCISSTPVFTIVLFSPVSPFPWRTFQPLRLFIGGMRWISIPPNCPASTDGINS